MPAADELTVSSTRVKAMVAHVRGESVDPTMARNGMDDKLSEDANKEIYGKRSVSIEPVFGNIKENLRFRRFRLRGIDGVSSEWKLICAAHNLLKLRRADLV